MTLTLKNNPLEFMVHSKDVTPIDMFPPFASGRQATNGIFYFADSKNSTSNCYHRVKLLICGIGTLFAGFIHPTNGSA